MDFQEGTWKVSGSWRFYYFKQFLRNIPKFIWTEFKLLVDIAIVLELYRMRFELQILDHCYLRQAFFFFRIQLNLAGMKKYFLFECFRTDRDSKVFNGKVISFRLPGDYNKVPTGVRTLVFTRYYPEFKYPEYIKFLFKRKEKNI